MEDAEAVERKQDSDNDDGENDKIRKLFRRRKLVVARKQKKGKRSKTAAKMKPQEPDPPEFGSTDVIKLLQIFPEEIWLIVFEKSKDPEVLETWARASPFFMRLLGSRRVEFLFPKVLKIVSTWQQKYYFSRVDSSSSSSSSIDFNSGDEIEDNQTEGRTKLINLRQVCHCWNKGVIKFLCEHSSQFKIDGVTMEQMKFEPGDNHNLINFTDSDSEEEIFDSDKEAKSVTCLKVKGAEKVNDFMETFKTAKPNPLFHHKLIISDPIRDRISKQHVRTFWSRVTLLLRQYGDQVWYCEINLKNNIKGFSYYYQVRQWLELMPNLKVLFWKYPITWEDLAQDPESEGEDFDRSIPMFYKCRLEDQVRQNGLPTLKHLQVFKTDDLPYPILKDFFLKHDHINKLQFHRKFPPPPNFQLWYDYGYSESLAKITELSLVLWSSEEILALEETAQNPKKLVYWPCIKSLSIYWGEFNDDPEEDYRIWRAVFNFISAKCCTSSLKNLSLRLPPVRRLLKIRRPLELARTPTPLLPQPKLIASHVRVLKIMLQGQNESLDFILPLKGTLQELQVILECKGPLFRLLPTRDHVNESETIQFNGYHDRMFESNIWHLFLKLQKIVLKKIYRHDIRRVFRYYRKQIEADSDEDED